MKRQQPRSYNNSNFAKKKKMRMFMAMEIQGIWIHRFGVKIRPSGR